MEQEAARVSVAYKKMVIEASVAAKLEAHHRERAEDRKQARRHLREKANAQVTQLTMLDKMLNIYSQRDETSGVLIEYLHRGQGSTLVVRRNTKTPVT